jgi:hypothetical protein
MSFFTIGFSLLGTIEYPQAPFAVAKVSLIGYNRIPSGPFAPCGLVGIVIPVPLIQQDKLTRVFLINQ